MHSGRAHQVRGQLGVTVKPSIQKGAAQAEGSHGSLTIRLNMPVMRIDQVWLDHSHKVRVSAIADLRIKSAGTVKPSDLRQSGETSGFKREFDPGSESTLAACLTHASRTRKW